jgi:hypothetical protein
MIIGDPTVSSAERSSVAGGRPSAGPSTKTTLSTMRDANESGAGLAREEPEVEGTLKWPDNAEMTDATTSPVALPATRLRWSSADTETALLVLVLKGLVLFLAALSIQTLFDQKENWSTLWTRWDASHYLSLAKDGYTGTGDGRFSIVFYPLYPWLVRAVAFVCRSYFGAALLVSGVASICAALLLRRITELDQPAIVARMTVWFLLIFPTAYFLHIGYTESLFLALVLGCLLAARKQAWAIAGVLGALACMTRVNGLLLVPTLLVEAFLQYRDTRRIDWRWLWIAAPTLGFLAYLFLNYRVTGDPFAFSPIMEEHWYKKILPPWVGIHNAWTRIFRFNLTEGLFEFIFIVFSFLCTVWCWVALRPSYAVWMTLNWLLITSTTFVVSVPRYCLALFPIFIILARLASARPLAGRIITATSLFLLALFAMKFAHGTWAF